VHIHFAYPYVGRIEDFWMDHRRPRDFCQIITSTGCSSSNTGTGRLARSLPHNPKMVAPAGSEHCARIIASGWQESDIIDVIDSIRRWQL
jgi:hypothetical protein